MLGRCPAQSPPSPSLLVLTLLGPRLSAGQLVWCGLLLPLLLPPNPAELAFVWGSGEAGMWWEIRG